MGYQIWDKTSKVFTPNGKVFTAEEWIAEHPIAGESSVKVVLASGEINGAFFGTLGNMVEYYKKLGADFTGATTDKKKLDVIEAFEDSMRTGTGESSAEERIACALETQILMSMETVNSDDPDID